MLKGRACNGERVDPRSWLYLNRLWVVGLWRRDRRRPRKENEDVCRKSHRDIGHFQNQL
jgi:hypothetical protein